MLLPCSADSIASVYREITAPVYRFDSEFRSGSRNQVVEPCSLELACVVAGHSYNACCKLHVVGD